jgi:predicted ATP-dependent endonuclease of OLD family
MKYIYVDNFRGFQDTLISMKQVNFLVGENSTGKTSIMSLIKLISAPSFLAEPTFNTSEIQFGNFSDIVSINSKKRDCFSVGYIDYNFEKEEKYISMRFLKFIEKDGIPSLSEYIYMYNANSSVHIKLTKNNIYAKEEKFKSVINKEDELINIFKRWTIEKKDSLKDYKNIKNNIDKYKTIPIFILTQIVESKLKLETGSLDNFFRIRDVHLWTAPIRTKAKRTYDEYNINTTPEGDHAPYILRKILDDPKKKKEFDKFIIDFGNNSGLMRALSIHKFGKQATSPFELNIALENKELNIMNVGYGVSQMLPILVDIFAVPDKALHLIQQPEVHLHPKAQAALGDIFYNFAVSKKKNFIIETHSDYTIDRFRLNYEKNNNKILSQVLFFERKEGINKIYPINIEKNGKYSENQPNSFRKFFVDEQVKLLEI